MNLLYRLMIVSFLIVLNPLAIVHATALNDYYHSSLKDEHVLFNEVFMDETIALPDGSTVTIYMFVGDIFDFINQPKTPIGGVMVSTNTGLNLDTCCPQIQRNLVKRLPKEGLNEIRVAFKKKGELSPRNEAIGVRLPDKYTPNNYCFIATDKPDGGTGADLDWVDAQLNTLSRRVESCFKDWELADANSVVTPLLASSKVKLQDIKLETGKDRLEFQRRMAGSVKGILEGIAPILATCKNENCKLKEFAIVVWSKDIEKIMTDEELKNRSFRNDSKPGGYQRLVLRLNKSFSDGVKIIRETVVSESLNK